MRCMLIIKATPESEAGDLPTAAIITAMGKFNEELIRAGVMLAGDGLQASSKGARVYLEGDKRTVVDGPFAETKELVAGYWILQVKSLAEAIEWTKRVPSPEGSGEVQIEVRRMWDAEDFAPAVKDSAAAQAVLDAEIAFRDRAKV